MSVKERLAAYASEVETYLNTCLKGRGIPDGLLAAMEYSLLGGGKRLRPALCLVFARMFGAEGTKALPFAAAFELIHCYSLIHDDLPAMDDDDMRRGKPSNHKAFGEATAILAGDGLLTEAFTLACETKDLPAGLVLTATRILAQAAGAAGMVGGQALDMEMTGAEGADLPTLAAMQAKKTGALIRAACECGAVLGGADAAGVARAVEYGLALGAAFQIVDDILDVVGDSAVMGKPAGSDEAKGKTTYPSLVGLDESKRLARAKADAAVAALSGFAGPEKDFLADLASFVVERVS